MVRTFQGGVECQKWMLKAPLRAVADLQAAADDALAALDRLERAVKVRPGDDPRLIGLVRGAKDAVRAVAERTTR